MEKNFALKDMFNPESVGILASAINTEHADFPQETFIKKVFNEDWDELALKERVRHITLVIGELLPRDYQKSLEILKRVLPHLEGQGFEKMVFPDFVEVYGLDEWDLSISALEFFTQHVSGEFAIRHFIDRYPTETLQIMEGWTDHPHPGVRRLASEGCRPRLPWGMRLSDLVRDPSPILPILQKLKDDEREEIRRSVANNLNDISKDHPELIVGLLGRWQDPDNLDQSRLIKHALRTLLKAGHPGALDLLGFSSKPEIIVENISLEPEEITLGEDLIFSFEIQSTGKKEQALMVDYQVHFMKANGAQSPKVFKLNQRVIQPGERIRITRKHSIKPITTRKYYPGIQTFQPQVNGKSFGKKDLLLHFPEK
jgi:3-methyladenine DNA glycosylase AlkC